MTTFKQQEGIFKGLDEEYEIVSKWLNIPTPMEDCDFYECLRWVCRRSFRDMENSVNFFFQNPEYFPQFQVFVETREVCNEDQKYTFDGIIADIVEESIYGAAERLIDTAEQYYSFRHRSDSRIYELRPVLSNRLNELMDSESAIKDLKSCQFYLDRNSYLIRGAIKIGLKIGKTPCEMRIFLEESTRRIARKPFALLLKMITIVGGSHQRLTDRQKLVLKALINGTKTEQTSTTSEMKDALRALGLISARKHKHDEPIVFTEQVKKFLTDTFRLNHKDENIRRARRLDSTWRLSRQRLLRRRRH